MLFRFSQKLNTRLKIGTLPAEPLHPNPLLDWSAHLFNVGHTRYILVSNTPSCYSILMHARGITDHHSFLHAAFSTLRDFLRDDGHPDLFARVLAPHTGTITFSKALNRSTTGIMNELAFQASVRLAEGTLSPYDASFEINHTLISSLPGHRHPTYGSPRQAFSLLLPRNPSPPS